MHITFHSTKKNVKDLNGCYFSRKQMNNFAVDGIEEHYYIHALYGNICNILDTYNYYY